MYIRTYFDPEPSMLYYRCKLSLSSSHEMVLAKIESIYVCFKLFHQMLTLDSPQGYLNK
jgi:hypothetical protein